jgi:hypothetical protein
MDAFLLLAFLLACFLALILLSAVLLYIIPVRSLVEITIAESSGRETIAVTWWFMGITISHDRQGNRAEVLLFGRVLHTILLEGADGAKSPPAEPPEPEKPERSPPLPGVVAGIARKLVPRLESLGSVIWQESRFEELRGNVSVGLGDPAMTGMFYGYFWAARFVFKANRIHLEVEPVFDREIFRGNIEIRMRLEHPLTIILAVFRLLLDPAIRELAGAFRQRTPGAAAQ